MVEKTSLKASIKRTFAQDTAEKAQELADELLEERVDKKGRQNFENVSETLKMRISVQIKKCGY
ncbi:hypothetical protein STRDD10_00782 [Streptococcus sp. DD10]|nr:hypothetical protein STRDD10_00782 [Streptococcus sp. DD10]